MSQKIDNIFRKNRQTFFSRHEDLQKFMETYYKEFVENHVFIEVNRVNATERIPLAGFYKDLSGWRVRGELTISSCEILKGEQTRYDYRFIFEYKEKEKKEEPIKEKEPQVESVEEKETTKKQWKDFTEEEKEAYRQQKEQEKKEVEGMFDDFLKQQTIKDVVELIDKNSRLQTLAPKKETETEGEESEELDKDKLERIQKVAELKKIHGYSVRNYLLVLSQARKRGDGNFMGIINSYWGWKRDQGAQVKRNPDKSKPYSYKILVPVMKKGALVGFKLGSVFDISQTDKYEEFQQNIQEFENEIESKEEIEYESAVDFLKEKFPDVNIEENGAYISNLMNYNYETKSIIVQKKTSHEVFHGLGYHIASELELIGEEDKDADRNELLAELTCYILMKKFEIDPKYKIDYNFGYSNVWARDILDIFKFGEFEKIYNTIAEYVEKL